MYSGLFCQICNFQQFWNLDILWFQKISHSSETTGQNHVLLCRSFDGFPLRYIVITFKEVFHVSNYYIFKWPIYIKMYLQGILFILELDFM